jgi:THO complex subunit 1
MWYLIEDLLDSQDIKGCRLVFDYLESRRERLVAVRETKNLKAILMLTCLEKFLQGIFGNLESLQ